MSLFPLNIPPGVYRNGTEYQAKGRYYDTGLVRWVDGTLRPIGGWRDKTATTLTGVARCAIQWTDNSDDSWLAVGTHSKLYVMDRGGTVSNVTPARDTGTLGNDPISTTDTDATVTVADTGHGLTVGDTIVIAGATAVGGITVNGTWTVATVPNANSFTFEFTSQASGTATGGGASVTYVYEISPGTADSVATGGYGDGIYGDLSYGTPREDSTQIQDASVWSIDNFGQYINAIRDDHGTAYAWTLTAATRAAAISNAPTGTALVTTAEGFLFILGAGGNDRKVQWCDQADNTVWTPSATNQAGSYTLETAGRLMCGARVGGGTLILTNTDAWIARYTSNVSVYNFSRLAGGCGAVSRKAVASIGEIAVWMGDGQFWMYNGFVTPLHCDVEDYLFSDLNRLQRAKVTCAVNSEFSEIIWWYPSDEGTENDRYVKYNINDQVWDIGSMDRTAGCDRGAFEYPIYIDSAGTISEHEVGYTYDGATPFAEAGPLEIGNGDRFVKALSLIPDEKTQGDVTVTFKTKFYPNGDETSFGPYTASTPTDVRFQGRSFKVRYDGVTASDWRVGTPRLEIISGDKR